MKRIILFVFLNLMVYVNVAAENSLRMSTTTSTENSGLLAQLNPPFARLYKVRVDVIAVGTGKALKLGENGDVDVVFVHAPAAEKVFLEAGMGIDRKPVMHNDFVFVGPVTDPAGIKGKGSENITQVLRKLKDNRVLFISRGDDSGTEKKEKALWKLAGIEPEGYWYVAAGQGMGAVLRMADDKQAYTLTDRGTFISYQDELDLTIVYEGDKQLFNPYHIMAVNPEKHPHVNYEMAKKYIDYVTGPEGQKIIRNYQKDGQQLFYPDVIE